MGFLKYITSVFRIGTLLSHKRELNACKLDLQVYMKSAEDTSNLFRQKLSDNKILKEKNASLQSQIEYIYSILAVRAKCDFHLQYIKTELVKKVLLFTMSRLRQRVDLIVYSLNDRMEIAQVIAHLFKDSLVIDDLIINYLYQTEIFGKLVLESLVIEAKTMRASTITRYFTKTKDIIIDTTLEFYNKIGFEINKCPDGRDVMIYFQINYEDSVNTLS